MRRSNDHRRNRTGGSDPRKSKEAVDRMSGLPDSILLHILSFLPFKCAVRASLILRPFRGLWRSLSSLSFNECDFHACDRGRSGSNGLSNFVDHVLALHERPEIDRFHIKLNFLASASPNPEFDGRGVLSNRLDKWICVALKKKVKTLDVALGCGRRSEELPAYRLPSAVLSNSSLVELKLKACNVESVGQIQLKSLHELSMFDVTLSEEVMRNVVTGSPSLKKVSLTYCRGLRVLKFDGHPSLEELNVCNCADLEKVDLASSGIKILAICTDYPLGKNKIICPNVVTLELDGLLDQETLVHGSSLNDVAVYFSGLGEFLVEQGLFRERIEVKRLLEHFRSIANFTLCNWSVLLFSMWELTDITCPSFSWKSLTMILNLAKWHLPGICYLLDICAFLETLTMYVYPSNPEDIQGNRWNRACNFDGRSYWYSVQGTFHCLAHHLKNVMVYACVTEPYVIELIEYLLGNALVLEKMVISTKRNHGETRNGFLLCSANIGLQKDSTSDMLLDFSKKVLSLPRISPRAVVHMAIC